MNCYDIKSEQHIIYSLVNNFTENSESFLLLQDQDFFESEHRKWFNVLKNMSESSEDISLETFMSRIKAIGGEQKFISAMIDSYNTSPVTTMQLAKIVKNYSLLRNIQVMSRQMAGESSDATNDSLDIIEKYSNKLIDLTGFIRRDQPTLIGEIIPEVLDRIDKIRSGEHKTFGISTNLQAIDNFTGGIEPGQLYIIAARPSMGKTSLMLSIAKNISLHIPTLIFSMEMTSDEIALRLISQMSGASYFRIKSGKINQADATGYIRASEKLHNYKIFIDPTSGISVQEIRSKLKKMVREHNIKIIFIDYLQLMATPKMQTRDLEIGYITRTLKAIAKEENIPVVLLSQLNRAVESRSDKIPVLSDLRESGNIEQDADVVIFIHRDKFEDGNQQKAVIIIAKNRNGAIGHEGCVFLKESMDFVNESHRTETF